MIDTYLSSLQKLVSEFPGFRPYWSLRGGHLQTLGGHWFQGELPEHKAKQHRVVLPDGDILIAHDDCPETWTDSDHAVLMVHGLGGSHQSPYLRRATEKLNAINVRTFRLDLRGAGAGENLAKRPYNAALSGDVQAAARKIEELCPNAPLTLVGFSMGGNLTLKMLGESPQDVPHNIVSAMAVNPCIDLVTTIKWMNRGLARMYDRYFTRFLNQHIQQFLETVRAVTGSLPAKTPRRLRSFDTEYTAPLGGFEHADSYYQAASAKHVISQIRVPTCILSAKDDPIIPAMTFNDLQCPGNVFTHIAPSGGHMGYISSGNPDPDRRWMDWRVLDWVQASMLKPPANATPSLVTS